jgi:hypothetical protein
MKSTASGGGAVHVDAAHLRDAQRRGAYVARLHRSVVQCVHGIGNNLPVAVFPAEGGRDHVASVVPPVKSLDRQEFCGTVTVVEVIADQIGAATATLARWAVVEESSRGPEHPVREIAGCEER